VAAAVSAVDGDEKAQQCKMTTRLGGPLAQRLHHGHLAAQHLEPLVEVAQRRDAVVVAEALAEAPVRDALGLRLAEDHVEAGCAGLEALPAWVARKGEQRRRQKREIQYNKAHAAIHGAVRVHGCRRVDTAGHRHR